MVIKKLTRGVVGIFAVLGIVVGMSGATANAMPVHSLDAAKTSAKLNLLRHVQFEATGFPTFYEDNFTNPPQLNQRFILEESLREDNGGIIGSNHIECRITAFIGATVQFRCNATFTLTKDGKVGTLNVRTTFNFDPANPPSPANPDRYDALILGGTGAYVGAFGVIHVTDPGRGNPTGYVFDFYTLLG